MSDFTNIDINNNIDNAVDKKIINGKSDVNILIPFKYEQLFIQYKEALSRKWMPTEVNMSKDLTQWNSGQLTEPEMRIVKRSLGFLSASDSLVQNNLGLIIFKHITLPEARLFILNQLAEEGVHVFSYQHIAQSLNLDEAEIFNLYHTIPSIRSKCAWALKYTKSLMDPHFKTGTIVTDKLFLKELIAFYIIFESIFFVCNFAMILSMGRRNLMTGIAEQFQYIMKDEYGHFNFGAELIQLYIRENFEIWDDKIKVEVRTMITEATELEKSYVNDTISEPIIGMNANAMCEYVEFIANKRAVVSLGLDPIYPKSKNTFPWMDEILTFQKEKNFFETTITEYQSAGALEWD